MDPRTSTSPRWASKAASSSASDSSAGDWLGVAERETTGLVLELMRCRLHPGFLRLVFVRSRAIVGATETRVDRMLERTVLGRARARTAGSIGVFENGDRGSSERV